MSKKQNLWNSDILRLAIIDSFQHWIYTHPTHNREERKKTWLAILDRFSGVVDWTGWEATRESMWQRQGHIFHAPFYYVEYGIAQLGALQLWMKAKDDPATCMWFVIHHQNRQHYRHLLTPKSQNVRPKA